MATKKKMMPRTAPKPEEEKVEEKKPEESHVGDPIIPPEETTKPETPKKEDTVKVKVLVGTLHFEQGTFEKGDVFEASEEQVKLFDPKDIKILK